MPADGYDSGDDGKACKICQKLKSEPSAMDKEAGRETQSWGLRKAYGELCAWCKKMVALRYSYMNQTRFLGWVDEHPTNLEESQMYALAYLSLREDGKVHVNTDLLEKRFSQLRQWLFQDIPCMRKAAFAATMPLGELARRFPDVNPIAKQWPIQTILSDGQYCLGVEVPMQKPETAEFVSKSVPMASLANSGVCTTKLSDIEALSRFALDATRVRNADVAMATSGRSALAAGDGDSAFGGSDELGEHDDEDEEESGSESDEVFPTGRVGTAMQKCKSKVAGLLKALTRSDWRNHLRETTVRSLLRTAAGLEKELQGSDTPSMIAMNEEHLAAITDLQTISRQAAALSKEFTHDRIKTLVEPLGNSALRLAKHQRTGGSLDAELNLLLATQAFLSYVSQGCIGWQCPMGGLSIVMPVGPECVYSLRNQLLAMIIVMVMVMSASYSFGRMRQSPW